MQGAAAALDYVLGRRGELPTEEDRCVAFVDAGASGVQFCVVRMRQDVLQVLSHAHAADAGGTVRGALARWPSTQPGGGTQARGGGGGNMQR